MSDASAMHIWYQSMTVLEEMGPYEESLRRRASQLMRRTDTVEVRGIEAAAYHGHTPGEVFRYPYLKAIVQRRSMVAAIEAERSRFDAYIIGSFSEPFLKETRSAVEIPVISMAESCMSTALSLADRFALISLSSRYAHRLAALVRRHGLESRFGGAYGLTGDMTEREMVAAFASPRRTLDQFLAVASEAAGNGVDLIIPAEGMISQLLFDNGVRTIAGADIMDSVGVCLLHARMLVEMKRALDLGHCRHSSYPVPPRPLREEFSRDMS